MKRSLSDQAGQVGPYTYEVQQALDRLEGPRDLIGVSDTYGPGVDIPSFLRGMVAANGSELPASKKEFVDVIIQMAERMKALESQVNYFRERENTAVRAVYALVQRLDVAWADSQRPKAKDTHVEKGDPSDIG